MGRAAQTHNQKPATSNQQPATSNQRPETRNQNTVRERGHAAACGTATENAQLPHGAGIRMDGNQTSGFIKCARVRRADAERLCDLFLQPCGVWHGFLGHECLHNTHNRDSPSPLSAPMLPSAKAQHTKRSLILDSRAMARSGANTDATALGVVQTSPRSGDTHEPHRQSQRMAHGKIPNNMKGCNADQRVTACAWQCAPYLSSSTAASVMVMAPLVQAESVHWLARRPTELYLPRGN